MAGEACTHGIHVLGFCALCAARRGRLQPAPHTDLMVTPESVPATVRDETPEEAADWHATMRDCVAEASVLADRIGTRDSEAGEAIQRLCNVVVWLVDDREQALKTAALQAEVLGLIADRLTGKVRT